MKDISYFFNLFKKIKSDSSFSPQINISLKRINLLDFDVVNPVLLNLIDKFEKFKLDEGKVIEIMNVCSSCIIRRYFCGLSTAALSKFFLKINNLISIIDFTNDKDWNKKIIVEFLKAKNSEMFPNDIEFEKYFEDKKIYSKHLCKPILTILDSYNNEKNFSIHNYDNLTIEHILPQEDNLPTYWKEMLGDNYDDIKEKYADTIGNLTLTNYNSKMGNKSFNDKKTLNGGFETTNLFLNKFINKQEK